MKTLLLLVMGLMLVGSATAAIYDGYTPPTYYVSYNPNSYNSVSTSYTMVNNLSFTAPAGSAWWIIAQAHFGLTNSTGTQAQFQLDRNGTGLKWVSVRPNAANNDDLIPFTYMEIYNGTGSAVNFSVKFASVGVVGNTKVNQSWIYAIRIDNLTGSQSAYTRDGTPRSNQNNVWADAGVSDTLNTSINVATPGNYLIFADAVVNSDLTTSSVYTRLVIDAGTEYIPYDTGAQNYSSIEDITTAAAYPFSILAIRNLTAGVHNFSYQMRDENASALSDWDMRTLFVIKLTGIFPTLSENKTIQQSVASTTYSNMTYINIPANNNMTFLTFVGHTLAGSSTSDDFRTRIVLDGVQSAYWKYRPKDVIDYVPAVLIQNYTIDGAAHYVAGQFAREDASGTEYVKNVDLLLLALAWPVTSLPSTTCTWSGAGDWVITDYCNITSNVNVCPNKIVINSTGRLNLSNNALLTATLFQFYPANGLGWRSSIKQGGLKKC